MTAGPIQPLADISVPPALTAYLISLPKADLHVHAETDARLDRVLARRDGQTPYDWRTWAARLLIETPLGPPRLARMTESRRADRATAEALDAAPDTFVARVADLLTAGAADGAILIEVRFGRLTVLRPDLMELFREAERMVQARYPRLRAEAVISGLMPTADPASERLLAAALTAARDGLAGIDFIPQPYETEADWTRIYHWADRAATAGLGITIHAGEFSPANLAAALRVPGLTRLGHAVYAAQDPRLLAALADQGITVECSLSSNVVLGAVESYEAHPLHRFLAHGIPVALATDNPVRLCTGIGREYAIAAALGCSSEDLLGFTRNAVAAAFLSPSRRAKLEALL